MTTVAPIAVTASSSTSSTPSTSTSTTATSSSSSASLFLKMARGEADEGTCRTDSLSDCSYSSEQDTHAHASVHASVHPSKAAALAASPLPPSLLPETSTDDSHHSAEEDHDCAAQVSASASTQKEILASPQRQSAGSSSSASTLDDDDVQQQQQQLHFESSNSNRMLDVDSDNDADADGDRSIDSLDAHRSARQLQDQEQAQTQRREFLLRGVSEPDMSERRGQRTALSQSVKEVPVSAHFPALPPRSNLGRCVSAPATSSSDIPFVPVSILKCKLSDPSAIQSKRFSWRVLPKPDIQQIHRRCSESINCLDRSVAFSSKLDDGSSEQHVIPARKKSSVVFKDVLIRQYSQTIGDNPAVSYGPPISLDWEYEQEEPVELEKYEEDRSPRRTMRQMILSYYQRRNVLTWQYGAAEEELREAKRAAKKIKAHRSFTNSLLPALPFEAAFESAGRKMRRLCCAKANVEEAVEEV